MCGPLRAPSKPVAPELTLSEMLNQEIGAQINPQALRVFIRANWPRVARLAHEIHGEPAQGEKR